ncbi:MAG: hypothetical protein WCL29_04225, partial [Pseudomonadota bacterium]
TEEIETRKKKRNDIEQDTMIAIRKKNLESEQLALAIDKDNQPHWSPAALKDVTMPMVEVFFTPRWAPPDHPLANLELNYG